MRPVVLFIAAALAFALPCRSTAQEKKRIPPKIERVQVGFQINRRDTEQSAYKAGLWAPIYIEIFGGTDGIKPEPNKPRPRISIETEDNDGVGTIIEVPVDVDPLQTRLFIGYVKTGHVGLGTQEITLKLHAQGREVKLPVNVAGTVPIDAQLYLTVGARSTDFHRAVAIMNLRPGEKLDEKDFRMMLNVGRQAVFETELDHLPTSWIGYNSVDMMILATDNRKFLTGLGNDKERLQAIAQWVRRGGRLIVPISRPNQDAVAALLQNKLAWQPAIPVVPPNIPGDFQMLRLTPLESWGNREAFEFRDKKNPLQKLPIPLATLDPGNVRLGDWQIDFATDPDKRPLMASVRYGLGKITYLAFSFEDAPFFEWKGKESFLKNLVENVAPERVDNPNAHNPNMWQENNTPDVSTAMISVLDNFDVKVIPFGYVALFIVLYILVVGPLDFFLLKYVFKRLEWTWITFPSVVLAVSVIAYFAAYALKGRDMKINKIDLVDFDLRTSLDENRMPRDVHAYGHSFFTILSPRIQNYTIGVEPNAPFWSEKPAKQMNADLLEWFGRPSGGMNNMGRPGGASGGFFRRPYDFTDDATGLRGVPIPVWTTKSFAASWEEPLAKPPFLVDLTHHDERKKDGLVISGKLENHLGVDLVDAWIIYQNQCYPLGESLKRVKPGEAPPPISIFDRGRVDLGPWTQQGPGENNPDIKFNPVSSVRQVLFHAPNTRGQNHLLRPLDLSWRVRANEGGQRSTREAILVARVTTTNDSAETIATSTTAPVPTRLWLTRLPEAGATPQSPPSLSGIMSQCTIIRVLLPLKPADE